MQGWLKVASIPGEVDLARLSSYLYQQKLAHKVTEEVGQQVIWVQHSEHIEPLRRLLEQFLLGDIAIEASAGEAPPAAERLAQRLRRHWRVRPVTFSSLVLSVLGALLVYLDGGLDWVRYLSFDRQQLLAGELWRLATPVFLHFGPFHIAFNGMWLWVLGTKLEAFMGPSRLLGLILVIGVLSNTAQHLWSGTALFGGMSGVIYGLIGFIWLRQRLAPVAVLALPPGIIGFMLFWLVLCMSGVVTWIAQVGIANAAHLAGLVVGAVAGVLSAGRAAPRRQQP